MGPRKTASNRRPKAGATKTKSELPLLEEIERGVERAVRNLLEKEDLSVQELVKLRDVVREILAERPHELVVRWVDACDESETGEVEETEDGGELSER